MGDTVAPGPPPAPATRTPYAILGDVTPGPPKTKRCRGCPASIPTDSPSGLFALCRSMVREGGGTGLGF